MKKTARTLISILLTLLMLTTLLPIGAMAEGETHITEDTENNTISNSIIDAGVNVTTNNGYVKENNGNISTSNSIIDTNNGTVGTAKAPVVINNGTVGDSKAQIYTNTGTVTDNNGRINETSGTVVNNNSSSSSIGTNTGTVTNSAGFIFENYGQVGTVGTQGVPADRSTTNLVNNMAVKNADGTYQEGTGVVDKNYGFLVNNGDYNIKIKEKDSGTLNTNEGIVNGNYGTITTNNGRVDNNDAVITENQGEINYTSGNIGTNGKDAYIYVNQGTVDTNDGYIGVNPGGTIGTNNGTLNNFAYGKIETNNGVINECGSGCIVTENNGTINDGKCVQVVTNGITGVVNDTGISTVENNFGKFVCNDGNTYLGLSWGSDTKSLTLLDGQVVAGTEGILLDKIAAEVTAEGPTRSGYKLTGYTWLTSDGAKVTDTENYTMNAPTWLKLLWEKIVTAVAPDNSNEPAAKPVKAAAIPSTVKAEDVKVGTVVRAKGQTFKVIEADDGSMTIVTMGKLSKKDMADLKAFLSKYFTPEQIKLLMGDPELISEELAAQLFGGNTGHIVFKAAKNLFQK